MVFRYVLEELRRRGVRAVVVDEQVDSVLRGQAGLAVRGEARFGEDVGEGLFEGFARLFVGMEGVV